MTTDPASRNIRILVADDYSAGREILCRRLSAHGFETVQAGDGEQALTASGLTSRIWCCLTS